MVERGTVQTPDPPTSLRPNFRGQAIADRHMPEQQLQVLRLTLLLALLDANVLDFTLKLPLVLFSPSLNQETDKYTLIIDSRIKYIV